jgi:hypothetical protein
VRTEGLSTIAVAAEAAPNRSTGSIRCAFDLGLADCEDCSPRPRKSFVPRRRPFIAALRRFAVRRGERWRETLQAIKTVGATRLAALYEEALTAFPHGEPASDYETRYNQLLAAGALGGEGLLWELTGQYYDLQAASAENCLYQRMTAFAIKQLAALSEHEPA